MKRWLGDSVIPQAHPVRLVVRRRGTEVVEAGTLEQPELPDGLVHVRRVEHADLGEPCDAASQANQDYLRELGATPVLYGEGVVAGVRAAAGGGVDAVFDVAGKTAVEELISLAPEPAQVVTIANFAAGDAGVRVSGGGADSHPMEALAQVAQLLAQNKLVINVQTFPFDRAADAYRISQAGHVRGKLVLVP